MAFDHPRNSLVAQQAGPQRDAIDILPARRSGPLYSRRGREADRLDIRDDTRADSTKPALGVSAGLLKREVTPNAFISWRVTNKNPLQGF